MFSTKTLSTDAFQGSQDTGAAGDFFIERIGIPAAASGCRKDYQNDPGI